MRLYSLTDAVSVNSGGARYEAAEDGGFDFPDELASQLHSFHVGGKPAWETYDERRERLIADELGRPAAVLAAIDKRLQAAAPAGSPAGTGA
jgi:hypothetical protein